MNTSCLPMIALVDRRFPCDHSFLEGVLEKRLPQLGVNITWVMRHVGSSFLLKDARWSRSNVVLLPSVPSAPVGKLLLEHLLLLATAPILLWRIWKIRPKIIFVRNDPLYLLFAVVFSKILRCSVVFQLSHLKEEDLLARAKDQIGLKSLVARCKGNLALKLRNGLIKCTDRLLVISQTMQQILADQVDHLPPTSVFPLGVDMGIQSEAVAGSLPSVRFDRYVIYVGTMASRREPRVMIDALRRVQMNHTGVGLVLVGGGGEPQEREILRRYVKETGSTEFVQFIPDVPRALLPPLISGAVCGLCVMPADSVNRMISPTKLMEYLQFECPVVAAKGIPEQDEIVMASEGGLLVDFNAVAISDAVSTLIEQPKLRDAKGKMGRNYIEKHRDYSIFATRLFDLLVQVVSAKVGK